MDQRVQRSNKATQVSIIILTHNGSQITLQCLAALHRFTTLAFEVILVDNGSNSKEKERLQRGLSKYVSFPLRRIRNTCNEGYSAANNQAARMAKGKILLFLNNDVIVTDAWLEPLVTFLEKHPHVAACQPKLHSFIYKDYFDYAGGAGGFLDIFGYPFTRGRIFDHIEKDNGQYDTIKEVSWATGACLAIKKEAFFEVEGFNEYFFAYAEEVDLCIRLAQGNYKIYCIPQSIVYHYGAYTSNKNLSHKIYLIHRNHIYIILKYYSLWPYFPLMICRILLDGVSILYYLRELRFSFILAVVNGYGKLLMELPSFIKQGVISVSGRSLLQNNTLYKGSIVIDYFLLGRKNFDEIMDGKHPSIKRQNAKKREYKKYADITFSKWY